LVNVCLVNACLVNVCLVDVCFGQTFNLPNTGDQNMQSHGQTVYAPVKLAAQSLQVSK
jgi:hypothetical protein